VINAGLAVIVIFSVKPERLTVLATSWPVASEQVRMMSL
jgi:hypothetical protein